MRKIFVARAEARILPLAKSASVTPTVTSVASTACSATPGNWTSKMWVTPPMNRPSKAA